MEGKSMAKRTQQDYVLDWLKTGAGITSYEAFKELGATRLSAIIFNLRKKGYEIKSEPVERVNRFGDTVRFSRYTLVRETEGQQVIVGLDDL